jgi:hypothetical protein
MKSSELRKLIREEILKELGTTDPSFLQKVGGSVRARLGTGRAMLDRALDQIDTERLSKLPRQQKIDMLVALISQFGIDGRDFNAVKSRVQRMLSMQDASANTSTNENIKKTK